MNTDVIILSRTKMSGDKICVGGLDLNSGKMLRLLDNRARALTSAYPYSIGETYSIEFAERYQVAAPHVEDVAVYDYSLAKSFNKVDLDTIVHKHSDTYNNLSELFSGKLHWQNSKGYALESDPPEFSVQIAKINKILVRNGTDFQEFGSFNPRKVKYVGELDINRLPSRINPGTPIRFSLARPWDKDNNGIKVCYLQLSGVYI
ncbi:hypothetical protein HV079_15425 [Citrobacter freundii]|uniref:dual OB domain-containing protein n=1 Tax=Citrobacter freundii TaxID=546 RepID=UPI0015EA931D|nr:hypothetical protein [Citrobacter freundii]QLZ60450.1 hypothetical protein HV079_15425 [Citrobacter freundii]